MWQTKPVDLMPLQRRPRISWALAGSDAAQILDGATIMLLPVAIKRISLATRTYLCTEGGGAKLNHHRLRERVKHHIPRQQLTSGPFFCLPWRHAAVVLFGKTWRAAAVTVLLAVILADNHVLLIAKIAAHPDILCRLLGLLPFFC